MKKNTKYFRYAFKYEGKEKLIPLNMPNFCPICMSQDIVGKQKLRVEKNDRNYILIPVCSKHYRRIGSSKNIKDYFDMKHHNKIIAMGHHIRIITVLIMHKEWAEMFKKLNQCEYYDLDEQLIKDLNSKIIKFTAIFFIWVIFCLFIIVLILLFIEWFYYLYFFFFAIVYLILFIPFIYYIFKKERAITVREIPENNLKKD